jgi:glucosamine-6-phosphate deaminase
VSVPALRVADDAEQVASIAADVVENLLRSRPSTVFALPTGRTPLPLYDELAERYRTGRIDFSAARVFNLDEWVGVPAEAEGSYARFMADHLFSRVNLRPENCYIPNGMADDLEAECRRYEERILAAGGIDLAILGIGRNGHIGFNEPGTPLNLRTHVAEVAEDTRRVNAYGFPDRNPPPRAFTMGVATILEARAILLLATGAEKADVLARAFRGPVDPAVPASALQQHPRVQIVGDRAALSGLQKLV